MLENIEQKQGTCSNDQGTGRASTTRVPLEVSIRASMVLCMGDCVSGRVMRISTDFSRAFVKVPKDRLLWMIRYCSECT